MSEVNLVLGIEVEGNKLLLSEAAARELYRKLKEIFEDKHAITYVPYPVGYPVYREPQPLWWFQPVSVPIIITQPTFQWYNTCGGAGTSNISSSFNGSHTLTIGYTS